MSNFELTGIAKAGGALTKRISLAADGTICSDGSACVMSAGGACRLTFDSANLQAFADCINTLEPNEAIALGRLRADLPDEVQITTKSKLNGKAYLPNDLIARTAVWILYRPGELALVLLDIDTKDIPPHVRSKIDAFGGYRAVLASVLAELEGAGMVARRSTSAGLYRTDTREKLLGSDGRHVYVLVMDGIDIPRFLECLHERLWLAGFGWFTVSRAGQLLDRSLIDRSVHSPERLVFEGAPVLEPPLAQDHASRAPEFTEGPPLDTRAACPDLTAVERAKLRSLKDAERHRLKGEAEKVLTQVIEGYTRATGCTREAARLTVTRRLAGILLPDMILPFDDDELAGKTVADVLANPGQFVGETLADPLEGTAYGVGKAKIMPPRADGSLWIHSFAHGRSVYSLQHSVETIMAAVEAAPDKDKVTQFVRLLLTTDLPADEEQKLLRAICDLTKVGIGPLKARVKAAREEQKKQKALAERQRRAAKRKDPRPRIPVPALDDPWLPVMATLNEVLGASSEPEPPMRDIDGWVTEVSVRPIAGMHTLTAFGSNDEEPKESQLPPPELPLLTRLTEPALAEFIEKYIDYVDEKTDRSVHLPKQFVKHFLQRTDNALPIVTGVATLPLILPAGQILSGRELNREYGIVFRVPEQLEALLPRAEDCTAAAVVEAMHFLTDVWLADVATDYAGKCVLIALALTIIERAILPERPAFIIAAGQRSSGKTTAIHMISMAVLGCRAAASAWSPNEEERRKSLFSYLGEGAPLVVWDNLPRGATISCPSIEKALTAETYRDRVLGVTETRTVPATTIHAFSGNNITPRGDMASRSLKGRLAVDRPDPENRSYAHPDPIGWTEANRGNVLQKLHTILLANRRLYATDLPPADTRFKMWWHLVGSPIEQAAKHHAEYAKALLVDQMPGCPPTEISFRELFLSGEADEEQTSSLTTVLEMFRHHWPSGCKAREVAAFTGRAEEDAIEFKTALEQASGKALKVVTATTVTWRLKALLDAPVQLADGVVVLRYFPDNLGGRFTVSKVR